MKESSGELSMTVITIIGVIAIGGVVTMFALPAVRTWITNTFNNISGGTGTIQCPAGQSWDSTTSSCR